MRRTFLALLLLMLSLSGLVAQASPYQERIERSKLSLAYDPLNLTERLNLAYYQMLSGKYEQALPNYRFVLERDSANADAAGGLLWALNSLGQYPEVISEADRLIKLHPEQGLVYFHRATALYNRKQALKARLDYTKAVALSTGETRQYPLNSLVTLYQSLGDFPRSYTAWKALDDASLIYPKELIRKKIYKPELLFSLYGGIKDTTTVFAGGDIIYRRASTSLRFSGEEVRINDAHYRYSLSASLRRQFTPGDASLALSYINSKDSRAKQGYGAALELKPRIYTPLAIIRPKLAQHVEIFRRFNIYQTDLGLELSLGKLFTAYQAAYLYQDNDSANSDTERWVHSLDLILQLNSRMGLGLYGGIGEMAWFTNPFGGITDDFEPATGFAGASIMYSFTPKTKLLLYYQYGSGNDTNNHTTYLKLFYAI